VDQEDTGRDPWGANGAFEDDDDCVLAFDDNSFRGNLTQLVTQLAPSSLLGTPRGLSPLPLPSAFLMLRCIY
jgi:hypothetical protein